MTEAISIASVTVAYNGAHFLSRHLDALKRQTRKLDEIIVVNNASSDDTVNLLQKDYPEVTILNLPENGGVGGGYAAGISYAALTKKYDWVWLFDQDSIPAQDGLERLLLGLQYLDGRAENTAILASLCVHRPTKTTYKGLSWKGQRTVFAPFAADERITLVDMVISSGSLVRREAIEAVGLPRADFFMDFVDFEHCLRMRRHGFDIAIVHDSILEHVLGKPSKFEIFGRTKFWSDHVPWREYYKTRNHIFTMWRYYPSFTARGIMMYRVGRRAFEVLVFGKQKFSCLRMIYLGLVDGLTGKLGTRFP
jgi:GT2 family glycosyltransferase